MDIPPPTPAAVRRNRAGCVLFLALIALGVNFWLRRSSPPPDTAPVEQAAATSAAEDLVREQQEALLAEQVAAARVQTRRLYDERIELRRQKIQLLSESYERGGKREYDAIVLVNRCAHEISVAINYLDLDDKWIVRGWWNLKPGEESTTDAMTRNSAIFFYAENIPSGWKFDGSNREGSRDLPVSDERFDYLEGETNLYKNVRTVKFYPVDTGKAWTDHREVFECQAEAAEEKAQ